MLKFSDGFEIGSVRVSRVEEWAGSFLTPQLLFAGFDEAAYAATRDAIAPDYLDPATDAIQARIQSWVVGCRPPSRRCWRART